MRDNSVCISDQQAAVEGAIQLLYIFEEGENVHRNCMQK